MSVISQGWAENSMRASVVSGRPSIVDSVDPWDKKHFKQNMGLVIVDMTEDWIVKGKIGIPGTSGIIDSINMMIDTYKFKKIIKVWFGQLNQSL